MLTLVTSKLRAGFHLQIPELGELLATFVQEAGEWFSMQMGDLVGADIAPLSEAFVADITGKWLLAGVTTLMGLGGM